MNIKDIIEFIKNETPENEEVLIEAYKLVSDMLKKEQKIIDCSIPRLISKRDYDKVSKYVEMSKVVSELYSNITECAKEYGIDVSDNQGREISEIEEKANESLEDEFNVSYSIEKRINYEDYRVDENIAYGLMTDFCHMKPAAFSLDGVRYPARLWKLVLLQTCELLWEKNQSIFEDFVEDKFMQGKTRNYFSIDNRGMNKPELIKGTDIFIETNLSANNIRDVIIKMLDKYRIPHAAYKIYLSKDFNPLHTNNSMCDENIVEDDISENQEEKEQLVQNPEILDMKDYCADYDYKTQKCMNENSPYFVMECCKQTNCAYIPLKPMYVLPKKTLKKKRCPQCGNLMEKTIFPVNYEDEKGMHHNNLYGCWCEQCKKSYITEGTYQSFVSNKDLDKIKVTFVIATDDSIF